MPRRWDRLCPVGRRIVAEVIIGLVRADPASYLSARSGWWPTLPHQDMFSLPDLLTFAKGVTNGAAPMGGVIARDTIHDTFMSAFTPDAALLHAAERRRRIRHEAAIEPDHAEIEPLRKTQSASYIPCVEIGHQPVNRIVGTANGFVFVVK